MRRLTPTVLARWGVGVLVSLTLLVPAAAASAMPSGPFHAPSLADRDRPPPTSRPGDDGSETGRSGSGPGVGSGSGSGSEDDGGTPPPPPPPALPESPLAALLPLSAVTLGGVVIAVRHRRRADTGDQAS